VEVACGDQQVHAHHVPDQRVLVVQARTGNLQRQRPSCLSKLGRAATPSHHRRSGTLSQATHDAPAQTLRAFLSVGL
jgi:hypothetical protein